MYRESKWSDTRAIMNGVVSLSLTVEIMGTHSIFLDN